MIMMEEEIPFWNRHHITMCEIDLNIRNQIGYLFKKTDKELVVILNVVSEISDDVLSSYTGSGKKER